MVPGSGTWCVAAAVGFYTVVVANNLMQIICKECEYSLATCPYEMAVAECPKTRDAILKVMRGDLEEEMVEE
jgi:hypothetical protein